MISIVVVVLAVLIVYVKAAYMGGGGYSMNSMGTGGMGMNPYGDMQGGIMNSHYGEMGQNGSMHGGINSPYREPSYGQQYGSKFNPFRPKNVMFPFGMQHGMMGPENGPNYGMYGNHGTMLPVGGMNMMMRPGMMM